ncbi:MAG: iron-sulfur cluster repair di-iron protein [Melioribacteraceae bacterium]|nr:iron-sulfur cluster repair di-iron protein [Melioribacteraceae bacterium]
MFKEEVSNRTNTNLAEKKVKEFVVENFKTAKLFEKYGIDYCCNGNRSLKDSLSGKSIEMNTFIPELEKILGENKNDDQVFSAMDLITLSQYIVNNHHKYVKEAIPLIEAHLDKVVNAHSKNHPELISIRQEFSILSAEMLTHMDKEEKILFPLIKYLVDSKKYNETPKSSGYGTVQNPIRKMEQEHQSAGNEMEKIRNYSDDYKLPEDACTTYTVTYKELEEFEKDLFKHIHLENNILFPKAIELENELLNLK